MKISALKRKKNGRVSRSGISAASVTKSWNESQIAVALSTQLVRRPTFGPGAQAPLGRSPSLDD
jgi:hypothetical protein